jgi:hypothetical protein
MRNYKPQVPNPKEIPRSNKQENDQSDASSVLKFECWSFPGAWVLGFGAFLRAR